MKQRIRTLVITGSLMLGSVFLPAYGDVYYQNTTEQNIANGITYETLLKYTESGWHNVNVCRIDLTNKNIDLNVVGSQNGVATKQSLTSMIEQVDEPVVGINGDFFNMMKTDSPIGIMVNDGQLVSGPVLEKPYNTFIMYDDGSTYMGPYENKMTVTTANKNKIEIRAYNKISWKYHMMTVVDKNWGAMSPGTSENYPDLVEIVVIDDKVNEVRYGQPARVIPDDGYILLASGNNARILIDSIKKGDSLTLDLGLSTNNKTIDSAIGGGSMLINNGQVASFSEPINGNHPRSALGLDASGKELIMVTVDGRHDSYKGLNGSGLAQLMLELGSTNAMILDGGGSTTMALRELGNTNVSVVNHPSDGNERRIINSLVVESNGKTDVLEGILVEEENEIVMKKTPFKLSVKGYDTGYYPMVIDQNDVKYRVVKGKASIRNGEIEPSKEGKLIIEMVYKGKKIQKELTVIGSPVAIELEVDKYQLKLDESLDLEVIGIDTKGFRAPIDIENVHFLDTKGLGSVNEGVYKSTSKAGTTYLKAKYNGLESFIPLGIGSQNVPIGTFEKYTNTFMSYPSNVGGTVSLVSEGKVNKRSLQLNYDLRGTEGTAAAYISLGTNGVTIPSEAHSLNLWIKSATINPHWIKAKIVDGDGKVYLTNVQKGVDWTGWKQITADLPYDMTYPAKVERIYVVETEASNKASGSMWIDGLSFLKPYPIPTLTETQLEDVFDDDHMESIKDFDEKWVVYGGVDSTAFFNKLNDGHSMGLVTNPYCNIEGGNWMTPVYKTGSNYRQVELGDHLMVFLDNYKDGLRKSNPDQWPRLIRILQATKAEKVHVFLPKPIWGSEGFSDTLEADLLCNKLEQLTADGVEVNVFYGGGQNNSELRNGVRYIGMGYETDGFMTMYLKDDEVFYAFD